MATASGSGKAKTTTSLSPNGLAPGYTLSRETTTKIGLMYRLDSASRAGLAQTGISNPALLAWELLPYSFVVDWFVPVGNYLQAMEAFAGFEFVDGYIRNMTKMSYVQTYGGSERYWNGSSYSNTSVTGSSTYIVVQYNRGKLYTFPGIGSLSFKNPIGGDPLGRLLTAASLLRVLFK